MLFLTIHRLPLLSLLLCVVSVYPEISVYYNFESWNHEQYISCCCMVVTFVQCPADLGKCSLCYDRTKSLPGYAADPNNCAKFYQCVLYGDTWSAFSVDCPPCTFWDQEKLSCVQVYSGPECGDSTHETGTWSFTTPSK